MSNTKPDGGPAFPCERNEPTGETVTRNGITRVLHAPVKHDGMTLRDWFAGKALAGELASQGVNDGQWIHLPDLASRCFEIADAMISERDK